MLSFHRNLRFFVALDPVGTRKHCDGQYLGSYTLGQWPKLRDVFEHGEAELGTNVVEVEIRPSAIGKKERVVRRPLRREQTRSDSVHYYRDLPHPRRRTLRLPQGDAGGAPVRDQPDRSPSDPTRPGRRSGRQSRREPLAVSFANHIAPHLAMRTLVYRLYMFRMLTLLCEYATSSPASACL